MKESEMFRANKLLERNRKKLEREKEKRRICLFCDSCENTTEFDRLKVIGIFDAETGIFKDPSTKPEIYIRCRNCGDVEPLETEKEDEDEK